MQQKDPRRSRSTATLRSSPAARDAPAQPQQGGTEVTENDLRIAAHARRVKVFVYDLATPGFQPALSLTDATSPACSKCPPVLPAARVEPEDFPEDPCNGFFGRLHRRRFAAPFQGNYWANNAYGQNSAGAIHSRLKSSYRRCWTLEHLSCWLLLAFYWWHSRLMASTRSFPDPGCLPC
jgi:hypothetical protein